MTDGTDGSGELLVSEPGGDEQQQPRQPQQDGGSANEPTMANVEQGEPALSRAHHRIPRAWRTIIRLGPLTPMLVLACVGPLVGVVILIMTSGSWLPWFEAGGAASAIAFWALGVVLAAACLMPTHATALLAGYVFGTWLGTGIAFSIVICAAAIGHAVWARLIGSRVLDAIAASPVSQRIHTALLGRSFWRTVWLIALLRLSPLMPFAATNVLMASLGVRLGPFSCATAIGIAPRSIGVALVGAQLSELDWDAGGNLWSTVLAIAATLAVIAWIGRIARAAVRRELGDPAAQ